MRDEACCREDRRRRGGKVERLIEAPATGKLQIGV